MPYTLYHIETGKPLTLVHSVDAREALANGAYTMDKPKPKPEPVAPAIEKKVAEVKKEVIDKAYEAIEIAKKTGKLKRGTNEVTKVAEKGIAKLVVVAKDVNPQEIVMHIPVLCKEKEIPCVPIPSREDLGVAAGLDVSTSAVAIIQEGEAKEAIKFIKNNLE